jgi:lysophospholipase L1-like esterase
MSPGYPEAMKAVAAEKSAKVADVNSYVLNLPNWQTYVADGVHPNAPLYALIVTNVLQPKLEPMVSKLLCQ